MRSLWRNGMKKEGKFITVYFLALVAVFTAVNLFELVTADAKVLRSLNWCRIQQ